MGLQYVFRGTDSARCAAGVQCAGHEGAVVSLCMLPGPQRLIASCDSSGACRVWSGITGAGLSCFAEPGNLAAQATHSSSAWGRQPRSGKYSSHCTLHALRINWLPIRPSDFVFLVKLGTYLSSQASASTREVGVPCCRKETPCLEHKQWRGAAAQQRPSGPGF